MCWTLRSHKDAKTRVARGRHGQFWKYPGECIDAALHRGLWDDAEGQRRHLGWLPGVGDSSLKSIIFWCLIRRKLTLCWPVNSFQMPQWLLGWRGNKRSWFDSKKCKQEGTCWRSMEESWLWIAYRCCRLPCEALNSLSWELLKLSGATSWKITVDGVRNHEGIQVSISNFLFHHRIYAVDCIIIPAFHFMDPIPWLSGLICDFMHPTSWRRLPIRYAPGYGFNVLPNFLSWELGPQCSSVEKWDLWETLGHEDSAIMNRLIHSWINWLMNWRVNEGLAFS